MKEEKFQYISCYCLSFCFFRDTSMRFAFQYISCYCLSHSLIVKVHQLTYFNTSHVIVYHIWRFRHHSCGGISIHLMLLFICTTL